MRLDEVKTLDELKEFCKKGAWWLVGNSQYDPPKESASLPESMVINFLRGHEQPMTLVYDENEAWELYYRRGIAENERGIEAFTIELTKILDRRNK